MRARALEAEVVEHLLQLGRGEAAVARELDTCVADVAHGLERLAEAVLVLHEPAHGVELEGNLRLSAAEGAGAAREAGGRGEGEGGLKKRAAGQRHGTISFDLV